MKSIRRTLLLTVLLFLVVTLGVVSLVVYHTAAGALRDKQRSARELVEVRYEDQRDEDLRNRAELLARDVQQNFEVEKWRQKWIGAEAAAVISPLTPYGHGPWLIAMAQVIPHPITFWQNTRFATELTLHEEDIYKEGSDASIHEFIQMTAEWGATWSSHSLAGQSLPIDPAMLRRDADLSVRFDTIKLADGREARRVLVKHPVTRYFQTGRFPMPGSSRRDDGPPPSRAVVGVGAAAGIPRVRPAPRTEPIGPPIGGRERASLPMFVLQCAWDNGPDNAMLADKIGKRDEQLDEIDAQTDQSIRSLRSTLAWTVAGAVTAALFGGWVLVGLGLFPLKRLSYAVSQINPKDFRLPLDPTSLPAELNPVAERLSQALAQLHAAFEREKRAAADISHELRTPLAALTTTIEVACRKIRTADQYRQTLDECREIARQMSQLVERMLMLAWIDAGADVMRPESVEVCDLVGGVAAIAKPLAEVHGLTFKVTVPKRLTIRTDPDKLREVVMNLTHNAIEYNRPGGEVELSATPAAQGGVTLEVRDTGIGMSAEVQDKIFERFYRGDPSRQATSVHAGLGLAIVKEYVDRLGGRLTVDSKVGGGSRFRIDLPNAL
jgi:two-component system, OmpR family, heavy metal sensor histidine kinase CusS